MILERTRLALFALTPLLFAVPADGQALRGRVLDAGSGRPLAEAAVLVHTNAVLHSALITDSLGTFAISLPGPGQYTLTASRDGYVTAGPVSFDAPAGRILDVVLRLSTGPVVLEPLEVTARRIPSGPLGEARRRSLQNRRLGFGLHLDREEIDSSFAFSASELVRSMSIQIRSTELTAAGGENTLHTRRGGANCTLALFVDGVLINRTGGSLDDVISPDMIDAVEVYFGSTIVGGFQDRNGCGLVLVWSRRDSPRYKFTWIGSSLLIGLVGILWAAW